jgi:hypothetical protein
MYNAYGGCVYSGLQWVHCGIQEYLVIHTKMNEICDQETNCVVVFRYSHTKLHLSKTSEQIDEMQ